MAKKKKKMSYSQMVKKALARAKRDANPAAAKMKKKKKLESQAKKMSNKMTSPEKLFSKMMKELGVKVETQKVLGSKIYDFYIPSKNMMVEIDGDYFHGNPLIYEQKDLNKMQIRNIRNDKFKDVLAKGNGYEIERVWEYDLNNDYAGQKKRFKKLLKDG
jgi:very-short-patch-repair endonuclease